MRNFLSRMDASALNTPQLIISAGVILLVASPTIDKLAISAPWSVIRFASFIAYAINLIATTRPGQLDAEISADGTRTSPRDGKTLLAPAYWGFLAWIPVYLGNLVLVIAQFFISETSPIVTMLKKIAGPFIVAHLFQSLWCAAFRPKYSKYNLMYISVACLMATASSLSRAHTILVAHPRSYSNVQYSMYLLQLTIYFGWTTIASLINLNGAFVIRENSAPRANAWIGHVSVVSTTIIGIFVTVQRSAPVYGLVIGWGLLAIASSMKRRIASNWIGVMKNDHGNGKEIFTVVGLQGAKTQMYLCRAGTIICVSASLFVAL